MDEEHTRTIRELNDTFRRNPAATGNRGQVLITQGIHGLEAPAMFEIADLVQRFNSFSEDNDPHYEHDFGAFDYQGQKVFWKIDYYADDRCEWGSEDPADPAKTYRVLTIMLASEY